MFKDPVFLHSFADMQYTVINIVLVNGWRFCSAGCKGDAGPQFLRAGFFVPNLIGGLVLATSGGCV